MLRKTLILPFLLILATTLNGQKNYLKDVKTLPDHPRILWLAGEEKQIYDKIAANTVLADLHQEILKESDKIIALPVLERKQIGRRLLSVSREALRRIFYLSYSFRMTEESKYVKRAAEELMSVCSFSDWNQSHFLDVGEMTMAVAIGYDWLSHTFSPDLKNLVKNALISKGLSPSFHPKDSWFLTATNNWNQVCNAGMTFGALAVYEDVPDLSFHIIERAIESIRIPMKDYAPDGAYPEGYGYWDYGTSFNVLFLSALEKVFKTDFQLSSAPGFMHTGSYYEHMVAPSGRPYNYADAGIGAGLTPAMFWFAQKTNDPSLLWMEKMFMGNKKNKGYLKNRLLPALMIWAADLSVDQIPAPKELTWTGQGVTPVSLMRTSWTDSDALFLGIKGGTASSNHAHMDAGSFIMEAHGVRWAMDFGMQNYESLESKGVALWGRAQDAQRWDVFRYNNLAHNTLTVDNSYHRVKGYAPIESATTNPAFMSAVTDLSTVFEGQLAGVKRGAAIVDKGYVLIQDEIKTLAKDETTVRWTMLTSAQVKMIGKNRIRLLQDGKTLELRVIEPAKVTLKTWSTKSTKDYDADNSGTTLIGFEVVLPSHTEASLVVALIPQGAKYNKKDFRSLNEWKD